MTATAMPGSLLGMDTEEVAALGQRLVQDAAQMEQVLTAVRQLVDGLSGIWTGADFAQYHAAWVATHAPALAAIAVGLREHGQAALAQAQQQDRASAAVEAAVAGAVGAAAGGLAGAASYAGGVRRPPDRDMLLLAGGSYQDSGDVRTAAGTYHRMTAEELRAKGIDPASMITPRSGFAAALYRAPDGTYVLAYRGTDGWIGPDGVNNVVGGAGISEQSRQAVQLAQQVRDGVGAENVRITGHSLGGRLASVASIATGAPAVTFNAAGVSDPEFAYALHAAGRPAHVAEVAAKYGATAALPAPAGLWLFSRYDPFSAERAQLATGQIRSFHVDGEVLSTLQDNSPMPDALGSRTELPDPRNGSGTVDKHLIPQIIAGWDKAYPVPRP